MAEMTATVRQEWVNRYYSQEQLKDKRRNLLRSCNYAMFRGLVRSGGIDQHLETNANECRRWRETSRARSKTMWRRTPARPPGTDRGAPALLLCRHKNQHHSDPAAPEYGQCAAAPVGVDTAYRNPRPTRQTTKGVPWYEEKEIRYDAIHELEGVQDPRQSCDLS